MSALKTLDMLIIESNPNDFKLIGKLLDGMGKFRLENAVDLDEGLIRIRNKEYHIVFSELDLPGYSHAEIIEHFNKLNLRCPVVIITDEKNRKSAYEAMKAGADECLFKSELSRQLIEKTIHYSIERKRMNRELYESERRYRRMFEYSAIGIYRSTPDGRLLEANHAFAQIFGYDSPAHILNVVDDISRQLYVNPVEREKIIQAFRDEKMVYKQTELQFYKKDGSVFTGLLQMRRSENGSGDDFVVEGYLQDITRERKATEQVNSSLQFLREIMENIPSPIFAKDINLRFTGCNKDFEKFIGFPEKEILGKTILELKEDSDSKFLHHIDREILKTRKKLEFERPFRFPSGEVRDMMLHKNVIADQNGNVNGIIGLLLDITDKKKAVGQLEEELVINEAMTELSKQLIKPGLSIQEISSLILSFCKSFTQSECGYAGTIDPANGDLVLYTFDEMIAGGCINEGNTMRCKAVSGKYPSLWGRSLNTLKPFYTNEPGSFEDLQNTPDHHFDVKNFLSVPVMINKKLVGQIAVANSGKPYSPKAVEAVKKLSNLYSIAIEKVSSIGELIQSKERAELSDKLKSAFLANMSHEIRTPLNAIVGFAQMLGEEGIGMDETREFKDVIFKNTDLLLRLINDIIEMAMIEAGELKIHPENRKVSETIQQVFETWKFKDEVRGSQEKIKYSLVEPDNEQGQVFRVDSLRFIQIMDNLIMNAFRFTPAGEVRIAYSYPGNGKVEISVSDTGIGISKEYQRTIFDRFRQVDELRVRPFSGTGLGLAITKKLTEHLSGKIRVKSAPGKGSTFTLTFPLAGPDVESATSDQQADTINSGSNGSIAGKNILIVEDKDSSYEFLEVLLGKRGAKIRRAISGREAIEEYNTSETDIILMDLQLPEMSGFDAIRKIRETDTGIPIIVQTAFSEQSERDKAFDAGCNAYIVKPITRRKLEEVLLKFC